MYDNVYKLIRAAWDQTPGTVRIDVEPGTVLPTGARDMPGVGRVLFCSAYRCGQTISATYWVSKCSSQSQPFSTLEISLPH